MHICDQWVHQEQARANHNHFPWILKAYSDASKCKSISVHLKKRRSKSFPNEFLYSLWSRYTSLCNQSQRIFHRKMDPRWKFFYTEGRLSSGIESQHHAKLIRHKCYGYRLLAVVSNLDKLMLSWNALPWVSVQFQCYMPGKSLSVYFDLTDWVLVLKILELLLPRFYWYFLDLKVLFQ